MNQNMFGLDVYSYNSQTIQEVVVETGGTSAEAMTGGVQLNIIPKDGGNNWSGSFSSSYAGPTLQATNLNDDLRARGLAERRVDQEIQGQRRGVRRSDRARQAVVLHRAPVLGIVTSTSRAPTTTRARTSCSTIPDLDRVARTDWYYHDNNLRLTWQATARRQDRRLLSHEDSCNCPVGLSGIGGANAIKGDARIASQAHIQPAAERGRQLDNPVTNKLLLEGAASFQGLKEQTEHDAKRRHARPSGSPTSGWASSMAGSPAAAFRPAIRSMAPRSAGYVTQVHRPLRRRPT